MGSLINENFNDKKTNSGEVNRYFEWLFIGLSGQ